MMAISLAVVVGGGAGAREAVVRRSEPKEECRSEQALQHTDAAAASEVHAHSKLQAGVS